MSLPETKHLLPDCNELIKGCVKGDRTCQFSLYQLYARKMMGICMCYAKNREEAEEILQDGFMRVFHYIHKYNGTGSFEGWMRKVMVSAALTKYRNKSAYVKPVVEFDNEFHDVGEEGDFTSLYDERKLIELIQTLAPSYRLVFNLYVFEGFKHREIAKMLNISEGTSKSNLADARKILQSALQVKNKVIV